ncbi:hypothetical protein BJ741DRAFT_550890 [Chytriomyces cf. hyalinus JEL632]|nr:hypothetical protein BJ741DRAFT_550890 [Chytriomyces cf. hyalinus JEL632]
MDQLRRILPHHSEAVLRACIAEAERVHGQANEENVAIVAMELALDGFASELEIPTVTEAASNVIDLRSEPNINDNNNLADDNAHFEPHPSINDSAHNMLFLEGIFPDADPAWLKIKLDKLSPDEGVNSLMDAIFELKGSYPKRGGSQKFDENGDVIPEPVKPVVSKGKEKEKEKTASRDYKLIDATYVRDDFYYSFSPGVLTNNFRRIPKAFIMSSFARNGRQLIPTYLFLAETAKLAANLPYKEKKTLSPILYTVKGKSAILDLELEALEEMQVKLDQGSSSGVDHDEAIPAPEEPVSNEVIPPVEDVDPEDDIECGCCYMDVPLSKMTQCDDGHLFCLECARRAAENLIGLRKTEIHCLDSGGCKFMFPRTEIERFLNPQVLAGYNRLCQEESLRVAGIHGLTTCPFCDYAVILQTDASEDKLFSCKNPECCVISCRLCKRKNHIPQSCEEAAKDDTLSVRHQIEEAMTQALLRKCPKCENQYYKTDGCNKMSCPRCHTLQCYVCKEIITGYDHFSNAPSGQVQTGKTCPLWEDTEHRNAQDVSNALQLALEEAKKLNPTVDEKDIHVEAPEVKEPRTHPHFPAAVVVDPAEVLRLQRIEQLRLHQERVQQYEQQMQRQVQGGAAIDGMQLAQQAVALRAEQAQMQANRAAEQARLNGLADAHARRMAEQLRGQIAAREAARQADLARIQMASRAIQRQRQEQLQRIAAREQARLAQLNPDNEALKKRKR